MPPSGVAGVKWLHGTRRHKKGTDSRHCAESLLLPEAQFSALNVCGFSCRVMKSSLSSKPKPSGRPGSPSMCKYQTDTYPPCSILALSWRPLSSRSLNVGCAIKVPLRHRASQGVWPMWAALSSWEYWFGLCFPSGPPSTAEDPTD